MSAHGWRVRRLVPIPETLAEEHQVAALGEAMDLDEEAISGDLAISEKLAAQEQSQKVLAERLVGQTCNRPDLVKLGKRGKLEPDDLQDVPIDHRAPTKGAP